MNICVSKAPADLNLYKDLKSQSNGKKTGIKLQDKIKLIISVAYAAIREFVISVFDSVKNKIYYLLGKRFSDNNKILSSSKVLQNAQSAWLINLALMQDALKNEKLSNEEKEQIKFLCANYLHKSSPIHLNTMRYFSQKFESMFQVCGLITENDYYHRFSIERQIKFGEKFNENLAMGNKSPLILTDTIEFQHFLPLKFKVFNDFKQKKISLFSCFENHFKLNTSKDALKSNLLNPILFDLTDYFKNDIQTGGDKEKEKAFKEKYNEFKETIDDHIEKVISDLIVKYPDLNKEKKRLRGFIKDSMTCICRVQTEKTTGMKVLPLYSDISDKKVLKVHHELSEFIISSGIGIGAVSLRKKMSNDISEWEHVRYEGPLSKKLVKHHLNKDDFMNLAIYQRFAKSFNPESKETLIDRLANFLKPQNKKVIDQSKQVEQIKNKLKGNPHIHLLGKATIDLIEGLLKSISNEKWAKLYSNSSYAEILDASLHKIREYLAVSELHLDNYGEFSQQMELINAEMATILEITQPFRYEDFAHIYKTSLFSKAPMSLLPKKMQDQFKMGLSKTSVNTFAGINAAILQMNPNPQCVYSRGFYFEQAGFIGYDHSFKKAMDDPEIKKIDLYCGQFNSNMEIDKNFTNYERRDIINDVREMLKKGKAAKHLTVALDCTIDNYNSENVKNVLEEFKNEINSGSVNFIFFRSGQKMDMLGMDNYYGSPFYMVNNGASHWDSFKSLMENPVHKTDLLSLQWFALSNKFIPDSLEQYRNLIFNNTRTILDNVPEKLKPGQSTSKTLRVNTAAKNTKSPFIDIKVLGPGHKIRSTLILGKFYEKMLSKGIYCQTRATFGLYHPNALIISVNEQEGSSSIRLHPGLNPKENAVFIEFLNELD